MCHPAVAIGVGAVTAYSSYQQQAEAARAQGEAYSQNVRNSLAAYADETRSLNLRERQEKERAATAQVQNDLQAMQLQSRAKVASANSGVFLNNNAIMQNLTRQGLVANQSIQLNLAQAESQLQEARYGATTTYQSRINSVARPNFDKNLALLTAGMQGIAAGASIYSGFVNPATTAATTATTATASTAASTVGQLGYTPFTVQQFTLG